MQLIINKIILKIKFGTFYILYILSIFKFTFIY